MHFAATRVKALAAAAAVTLVLAGCSGSSSDDAETTEGVGPTGAATDAAPTETASAAPENPADNAACQLIAATDIEAITGLPFSTTVPEVTTTTKESEDCEWWLDEAVGLSGVVVQLMEGQGDQLATTRAVAASAFGDVLDVEVEGTTGSFSYVDGTVLAMSVGGDLIQVTFVPLGGAAPAPALEGLAEKIVANR